MSPHVGEACYSEEALPGAEGDRRCFQRRVMAKDSRDHSEQNPFAPCAFPSPSYPGIGATGTALDLLTTSHKRRHL